MKIIDILNKIANGEETPKKIKYADEVLEYDGYKIDYVDSDGDGLFNEYAWITELNDEVEILDNIENNKQDKIEPLKYDEIKWEIDDQIEYDYSEKELLDKINEIIDRINNV